MCIRDSDKPKLIVIDESHNLRNDKSNRYKFLLEQVLKPNEDIKVLLLSATPVSYTHLAPLSDTLWDYILKNISSNLLIID